MNRAIFYCVAAICSLAAIPTSAQDLTITYPNGGETLVPGFTYSITWTGTSDNDSTRLEYSTDGGSIWHRIARSVPGNTYDWTVPPTLSQHCRLRAVQVWSTMSGAVKDSVPVPTIVGMTLAAFTRDGSLLALAGSDNGATAFVDGETGGDLTYKRIVAKLRLTALQFSPDGKYLALTGYNGDDFYLQVWDMASNVLKYAMKISNPVYASVSFSPDSRRLAYTDGYSHVIDAESGTDLHILPDTIPSCRSIQYTRDGKWFVIARDQALDIRDAATGVLMRHLVDPFGEIIRSVAANHDGSKVAYFNQSRMVLMNGTTGDTLYTGVKVKYEGWSRIRFSADDSRLIACRDRFGYLYDVETGDQLVEFCGNLDYPHLAPDAGVVDAAITDDGTRVATSSMNHGGNCIFHLLPTDVTDNEFSIAVQGLSATAVDLGSSKVGQEKDSTVMAFLSNQGASDVRVVGVSIVGKDSADFKLADPAVVPVTLTPAGTLAVRFAFTPSRTGLRTAKVMVLTESETLNVSITGTGLDTTAGVDAPVAGLGAEGLRVTGCYPSPVRSEAHLRYTSRTTGSLMLTVTDAMGRVILERSDIASAPGEHEIALDLSSVPSGMYAYKLRSSGQAAFGTMIVQH